MNINENKNNIIYVKILNNIIIKKNQIFRIGNTILKIEPEK
jgi:hypothetical protein